uniref:Uncharacterized protein n=1 Tax=viral metagenome TaxID=1070528 RepID=A0A6C0EJR9_9ZZZZ
MVKTYKNFLLIDREDVIPTAVTMAKNMGTAFNDDKRVWHVRRPGDKVIMIYREPLQNDARIQEYTTPESVNFRLVNCIGYIQLYCNGTNVKVGKYQFTNGVDQLTYWKMLKDYLSETIRISDTSPSRTTFTLFWERKLMNANLQRVAEQAGLLSDRNSMTYVFQESDVNSFWNAWGGGNRNANPWGWSS